MKDAFGHMRIESKKKNSVFAPLIATGGSGVSATSAVGGALSPSSYQANVKRVEQQLNISGLGNPQRSGRERQHKSAFFRNTL